MASLGMSLDDVIKSRKNSNRGGRGFATPRMGRGIGPIRGGRTFGAPGRNVLGINARPSAYTIAKSNRRTTNYWQNGLFEDGLKAAGLSGAEAGTKLYISNLDIGVSSQDIRELFSEIGELVRYAVHLDKNGRPNGSAEVVFVRRSDAFQAFKRYNNVQLDGRPMKLEIIGANPEAAVSARVNVVGGANGKMKTVVMVPESRVPRRGFVASNRFATQRGRRGGTISGRRGGTISGPRMGRGRGRIGGLHRKKKSEKSAEELDKELDNYHADAMQS